MGRPGLALVALSVVEQRYRAVQPNVTFVRAAVLSHTCSRSLSRTSTAAASVSVEPLSMSCRAVTESYLAEVWTR